MMMMMMGEGGSKREVYELELLFKSSNAIFMTLQYPKWSIEAIR